MYPQTNNDHSVRAQALDYARQTFGYGLQGQEEISWEEWLNRAKVFEVYLRGDEGTRD